MKILSFVHYWRYPLLLPHILIYKCLSKDIKDYIDSDVDEMNRRMKYNKGLIYYLSFHQSYRNLFYYRIGKRKSRLLRLYMKEYPFFIINPSLKHWGKYAFVLNHPYGTIINAKSIGDNFTICQLTTLGNKMHGQNDSIPVIGNNVSLGANVNIMGAVELADNVIVGAGSVVVKDVPANCVVAGNPARIIKHL